VLGGELHWPAKQRGLVLFAHGSGSSRHSPRNQYVARVLREAGMGTLLFDLLTTQEEEAEVNTRHLRFNIPFLSKRLVAATEWVISEATQGRRGTDANRDEGLTEVGQGLRLGYFGSSTGAAAALVASAELGAGIGGVVSRGGRPDLAGNALTSVKASTLLIVGGNDREVIKLNEKALEKLSGEKQLVIVPGASHLFEEQGKLEQVAEIAASWFARHLM
jgi:predicted alpha/beta-hydrolase family hydrolase